MAVFTEYLGTDFLDCTVGDKDLLQVRTTVYKCESAGR